MKLLAWSSQLKCWLLKAVDRMLIDHLVADMWLRRDFTFVIAHCWSCNAVVSCIHVCVSVCVSTIALQLNDLQC